MPKYTPIFALLIHISNSLDCYDFTSKFSIPCEELVWFEECFAVYNKSADGSWKMEDAGCSGKKMKSHLNKIMRDDGLRVKLSIDKKALFQSTHEGLVLLSCLDPFCNLPDKLIHRLEKELDDEEEVTTTTTTTTTTEKALMAEVPTRIKEDVIERILNGKKPFEVNNELGVNTHRDIRPLIFNAPDRRI